MSELSKLKSREHRGISIFRSDSVRQVDQSTYVVLSQSGKGEYEVGWLHSKWCCTCPDFYKTSRKCKHVHAVQYYLAARGVLLDCSSDQALKCPRCDSLKIVKRGYRYNKVGPFQRYGCKQCELRFTAKVLQGIRSEALLVMSSLDLYFRGLSLRNTAEHLEAMWGRKFSHTTILRWVSKYVEIVSRHMSNGIRINVERANVDDTLVRLSGKHIVLWASLDEDSRFLIAMHVSRKRTYDYANEFLKKTVERAPDIQEIVTDGLASYSQAIDKNFKDRSMIHIQGPGLSNGINNNKIERFNGVVKGRLKTMGTFHSEQSARTFANGYQLFHNYMKPHRSLSGRTPAQAVGLLDSKVNWRDLLLSINRTHNDEPISK